MKRHSRIGCCRQARELLPQWGIRGILANVGISPYPLFFTTKMAGTKSVAARSIPEKFL